jgi:hypothetical protein
MLPNNDLLVIICFSFSFPTPSPRLTDLEGTPTGPPPPLGGGGGLGEEGAI